MVRRGDAYLRAVFASDARQHISQLGLISLHSSFLDSPDFSGSNISRCSNRRCSRWGGARRRVHIYSALFGNFYNSPAPV
jgi:hypothetical protein